MKYDLRIPVKDQAAYPHISQFQLSVVLKGMSETPATLAKKDFRMSMDW